MKAQRVNRWMVAAAASLMAMAVSAPVEAASAQAEGLGWATGKPVNAQTLALGVRSCYNAAALVVAQSECQWNAAMADLAARGGLEAGPLPAPDVDWSHQSVVVVSMGRVPYGYSIQIESVRQVLGQLILDVHVGQQQVENYTEDVTPMHMVVLDTNGLTRVAANYDWALPTLVGSATVLGCGALQRASSGLGANDGQAPTSSTVSWGQMKDMYR